MHDFYDELKKLCSTVEREIEEANEKIRKSGGKISPADMEYVDKLTHTLKSIKTTMAMMDAGSEYDGYNYPSARGRRRDSMGRYSRADGMYHDERAYDDGFMNELRDLMDKAPNDRARNEINNLISKMAQM